MKQLRAEHQSQLEEISSQLLQFEASLRAKEKLIENNYAAKDQVIATILAPGQKKGGKNPDGTKGRRDKR